MTAEARARPAGDTGAGGQIDEAVRRLRTGELVVLPTETVYGLAGDAADARAVAAIYALKGRPAGHPLIVHVSSVAAARYWAQLGEIGERLAAGFWPGPLTLIALRNPGVAAHACGGHASIGLRVPSHPLAQGVLEAFEAAGGHGVAAPSANRFGRISPTRANHVRDDLGARTPFLLDGGASVVGIESTIVDVSGDRVAILRPGAITAAQLEVALGTRLAPDQPGVIRPAAPGTLAAHYAPRTPLELIVGERLAGHVRALADAGSSLGVYSMRAPAMDGSSRTARGAVRWLPMPSNARDLAAQLYDDLRRLDALDVQRIVVEQPGGGPEMLAVRDRLARAATGSGR